MVTLSASLGPAGRSTLCPLQPSPQPGSPRCRTELELLGCSAGPSLLPDQETGGCSEHPTHGAEPQPGTLSRGPAAGDPQPATCRISDNGFGPGPCPRTRAPVFSEGRALGQTDTNSSAQSPWFVALSEAGAASVPPTRHPRSGLQSGAPPAEAAVS